MKPTLSCLLIILAPTGVGAFIPRSVFAARPASVASTRLPMVDSSAAVQDALEASKKYGPTSAEARAAWDIVEEIDASNRYVRPVLMVDQ